MLRGVFVLSVLVLAIAVAGPYHAESACCYFSAKDKDVLQPAQKAFITWDPAENVETFTVQPKFEGNAVDFGMVVPTPAKPKLDEMPRDFFKELAVFTILEPMDLNKYKRFQPLRMEMAGAGGGGAPRKSTVKVVESGIVGSLDYKIITAEKADDLFSWLKDNKYSYAGDEKTLDFYTQRHWFFTVMKIDPMQMTKRPDGSYSGDVTPTRFAFASQSLIYPLKITQISVRTQTEALFYVQAPDKMDMADDFSYQCSWETMWSLATGLALPDKLTEQELSWQRHVQPMASDFLRQVQDIRRKGHQPSTLEWAKRITQNDIDVMDGRRPYNRAAPREDVERLRLLRGHIQKGQFITKIRKVFAKGEMESDLQFVRASVGGRNDDMEYYSILPTSPP
jgi:hypothetical protein